jgi:hypothetical protein
VSRGTAAKYARSGRNGADASKPHPASNHAPKSPRHAKNGHANGRSGVNVGIEAVTKRLDAHWARLTVDEKLDLLLR